MEYSRELLKISVDDFFESNGRKGLKIKIVKFWETSNRSGIMVNYLVLERFRHFYDGKSVGPVYEEGDVYTMLLPMDYYISVVRDYRLAELLDYDCLF